MHLQFLGENNQEIKPKWGTTATSWHTVLWNIMFVRTPMFAVSWKLECHTSHLSLFLYTHIYIYCILQQLPEFSGALLDSCWQRDFNFPSKCLDTLEYRSWGLFQQARFAVMGDGSLYPSENHSRWNLKPSLYHKCSKKPNNTAFCMCNDNLMHLY